MFLLLRHLVLGLFLVATLSQVAASSSDPQGRLLFQSYGRESGLGNVRINLLLQDKTGFIWVGTDSGLYRFDGQRFQAFGLEQGLPSLEINALTLDSAGVMWVGTKLGLARWKTGSFESMFKGYPDKLGVEEIVVDPNKELWIATTEGLYHGNASGFQSVPGWVGGRVNTVAAGIDGKTMWAANNTQLWTWQKDQGWKLFPGAPKSKQLAQLDRLFAAPDGKIFARTSRGNYVLAAGAQDFVQLPDIPVSESFLSRFHLGPDGKIWSATVKGLYHNQNGKLASIGLSEGLPTDFARAVIIDREGTLWCGSQGLHRLLGKGAWSAHTPKEGLPANVWSVFRDNKGRLWSGTEKGLAVASEKGWQVIAGSEQNRIRSIVQAPDNSIIFGGEPYGLWRLDAAGDLHSLPSMPGADGAKILSLLLDKAAHLWIGTFRAGLLKAHLENDKWVFEKVLLPGGSETERISHLMLDRHGRIWAAGGNGLLSLENGIWRRFGHENGLASSNVLYVAEGENDEMWIVYRDKADIISRFKIDQKNGSILQTGTQLPLTSRDIVMIGEDQQGRLWLGANSGLDLWENPSDPKTATIHFGIEDGLVDEEINAMAFLAETSGDVWIGTRGGLAHFYSKQFSGNPPPPPVAILSAKIGSRSIVETTEKIVVPHGQNTFEISFAGLSFLDTSGIHFETRLIGLEQEWHSSSNREARYAGLPPGHYTMEIRARFRQGEWGAVTRLSFELLPAWWQTWWFRIGLSFGLIGLVVIGYQRRVNTLRHKTEELESLVAARTADLEKVNQTLLTQSLTDPLTGLRNRRYLSETIPAHISLLDRSNSAKAHENNDRTDIGNELIFLMIDIDHFKFINDTYGHSAGDQVLSQTARILIDCTRESDTVARWGGEEFIVVARQAAGKDPSILMERIRTRFEDYAFDLGSGQTLKRTCSIGFSMYPFCTAHPHAISWEQLTNLADYCMYVAKRNGRNAWVGLIPRITGLACSAEEIERLTARLENDLPELISEGVVEVKTSMPQDVQLNWTMQTKN